MRFRILFASCLLCMSTLAHAQTNPAALRDTVLMHVAVQAVTQAKAIDAAWPGFWSAPQLVLQRRGEAYMFTYREPFPGFTSITDSAVPPVLRGNSYLPREGATLPTSGRITRGEPTPYILDLDNIAVPALPFLIHESFHMYQFSFFTEPPFGWCVPQALPAAGIHTAFGGALVEEFEQLSRAVRAADLASTTRELWKYFQLRLQRYESVPQVVSYTEQRQERGEGTADFVAYHVSTNPDAAATDLKSRVIESIDRQVPPWRTAAMTGALPSRHMLGSDYWYSTGAALTYLLDRYRLSDWSALFAADL